MKKNSKIILACVLTCLLILSGGFYYYQSSLSPLTTESKKINFNVEQNTAPNSVVEQLESQNIIKNSSMTKIMMKMKKLSNIKAGVFILDSSWSAEEVLEYLNDATNAESNEVLLTIPEGLWAKDIASRIEAITNVTAQDCLDLWNDSDFLNEMIDKYDFLTESILNENYFVKLEGYLYPDSYFIYRDTTARDITLKLLDGFNNVYNNIKPQIEESGYSVHELITFASVVQFESGKADEMPIIAGIFKNRFDIGMKMESSVTVCYALYDEFDNFMDCESNPQIDSPYNTYVNTGLPIGPVNNPSIMAIESVLKPEQSEYYYFISDVYGDQKLIPAKTYEEHLKNVENYLK